MSSRLRFPGCASLHPGYELNRLSSLRTQGPITTGARGYVGLELQRISTIEICGYGSPRSRGRRWCMFANGGALRLHLREPVIQRIARAAHGADRVLLAAWIEQLAQAADVDVDGAFVDIDVAAPDAVEQLLAAEHAAGMLEEKLQQAILGRAEIDRSARTRDAAFLAIEFDVAIGEHGGEPLRARPPQQALHPRQQFRHRERLDDVIVGAGRK